MATAKNQRARRFTDLAWDSPELVSFWTWFQVMAPAQAERASKMELVDKDEAVRRTGSHWPEDLIAKWDDSLTWIWVEDTPSLRQFVTLLLIAGYGLDQSFAQALLPYFDRDGDRGLMQFGHSIAEAASTWVVRDVEERLGISIGRAYAQAGIIPPWSQLGWTEECQPAPGKDLHAYEPRMFMVECLDGIYYADSFWEHYAKELFGDIPANVLRCDS